MFTISVLLFAGAVLLYVRYLIALNAMIRVDRREDEQFQWRRRRSDVPHQK